MVICYGSVHDNLVQYFIVISHMLTQHRGWIIHLRNKNNTLSLLLALIHRYYRIFSAVLPCRWRLLKFVPLAIHIRLNLHWMVMVSQHVPNVEMLWRGYNSIVAHVNTQSAAHAHLRRPLGDLHFGVWSNMLLSIIVVNHIHHLVNVEVAMATVKR